MHYPDISLFLNRVRAVMKLRSMVKLNFRLGLVIYSKNDIINKAANNNFLTKNLRSRSKK